MSATASTPVPLADASSRSAARAEAPITVVAGAATDIGLRRKVNEDSHLSAAPVFIVADGMGGHQAGEIASAIVIEEFTTLVGRASVTIDDVQSALGRARVRVDELSESSGSEGAGTTLAGVVVAEIEGEGYWLAVNLGDSRTYLLSDGDFEQISVDHSVVQELIDLGQLDPGAAAHDSRRNVITRALGAGSAAEPDFWLLPASRGDRVLVCSDGLSGEVDGEAIAEILRAEPNPQTAAERLVQAAIDHGGRDNVTALVVDVTAVRIRGDEDVATIPGGVSRTSLAAHADSDTRPRAGATEVAS
ncbi:PP2C family protein-serine/threonine phosphatase [Microbacterium sp. ASV49]|uniref:Protein phosphatase 2C domain-containing protein n=1 Tax=Microbacterium candidum TaxID=3041922 RepID=A0ABT7MUS7_9MICO|nr:protein phosphatase 2C domain-containing protein [Microbacterium sp. ASV49]MDL9978202.1 protein phosphatase 2C domain-containing protein [Microbacterium sp. ASV49]